MKRHLKRRIAVAVSVLFVLAAYCAVFFENTLFLADEKKLFSDIDEQNAVQVALREDVLFRQPFKALGNRLQNFHFPFCGLTPDGDGWLDMGISNSRGEKLCSLRLRQSQLADCGTTNGRDFFITFFDVDKAVKRNETLYLDILLTESVNTPPSIWCYPADRNEKNLLPLETGGIPQKLSLYVEYQRYQQYDTEIMYIAAAYLLFLAGLFLPTKRKTALAAEILIPIVVFAAFELLWNNMSLIEGKYILLNLMLAYPLYGIFISLFGRVGGAVGYSAAGMALAAANCFVNSFRGGPLAPEDIFLIKTALSVAGDYSYYLSCDRVVIMLAVFGWVAVAVKGAAESENACPKRKRNYSLGISAALLIIVFAFATTNGYAPSLGISNYTMKGWLYSNCAKSRLMCFKAPDGYSAERAERVLESVGEYAAGGDSVQNLIVIMSEAFSDLRIYPNSETNESPTPFFDFLEENAEKGYLSVPTFGGGTADTEWQMLCGMNSTVMDMNLSAYSFLFDGRYNTDGLCGSAIKNGYRTVAMHPYADYNYNRRKVYERMGFERFISLEDYKEPILNRGFVSDESDYGMIIDYHRSLNGEKMFVFNVTMQNHGGYTGNMAEKERTVQFVEAPDEEASGSYLSLLRKSDNALKTLISYFEKLDEPTMIVIFGDHQPALGESVYERLFDGYSMDYPLEMKFITPYLIWTNYERQVEEHIPFMSVNYFSAYIKRAANLPLDTYDSFRLFAMKRYPVLGREGVFDSGYRYKLYSELNEQERQDIDDIGFVQYYHLTDTD